MLTDTQLGIYNDSIEFIFTRLENVLTRSKADPVALKAFFLQLEVTLNYDKKYSDMIGQTLYPELSNIRNFFSKLSELLNDMDPEHSFVIAFSDPRFFSQQNNITNYKKLFSARLKQTITEWYNEELKKTELTDSDMIAFHDALRNKNEEQQLVSFK